MAKLERPKGYSRELWKQLTNKIRNIERFISEKTKTGVEFKSTPDVTDVYTAEGRKQIREWTAKGQWKEAEYVNVETGEYYTGKEAKKAWSKYRNSRPVVQEEPEEVEQKFDVYQTILDAINNIGDGRMAGTKGKRRWEWVNTGGFRTMLINMLNDLYSTVDNADEYLQEHQEELLEGIELIIYDSDIEDVREAFDKALVILNGGKALSMEQYEMAQDTKYYNMWS